MAEIASYRYLKKKMMADPDGYSNGRVHVRGMTTWKLFDKVEELEKSLASAFERIVQLERQISGFVIKKKS